jgi:hypothetical protein
MDDALTGPIGVLNDVPAFGFGSRMINKGFELLNGY